MGASAEVGRSSGVSADEHEASIASVARATTNRHARKIMGPTLRPDTQNPGQRQTGASPRTGQGRRAVGATSKSLDLVQAAALLDAAERSRLHAYIVVSLLTGARTEELRPLRQRRIHTGVVAIGEFHERERRKEERLPGRTP